MTEQELVHAIQECERQLNWLSRMAADKAIKLEFNTLEVDEMSRPTFTHINIGISKRLA